MSMPKGTRLHHWTEEERAYLAEIVPGRSHKEIHELMTRRFGDHFAGKRIGAAIKRYGLSTGRTGYFEKGQEPVNKGKTWGEYMPPESQTVCRSTCYRKGNMPHNHRMLGDERIDRDGYIWIKVESRFDPDGHNDWRDLWKPKHRFVWEQANGKQVPDGSLVVFADGDRRNFDPGNLVAMTRADHMVICHQGIAYTDRDSCEAAMAIAKLRHRINEVACRQRVCKSCGRKFEPENPRQVRCRECIDRIPKDGRR